MRTVATTFNFTLIGYNEKLQGTGEAAAHLGPSSQLIITIKKKEENEAKRMSKTFFFINQAKT